MKSKSLQIRDYKKQLDENGFLSDVDSKILENLHSRNSFKSSKAKEAIKERIIQLNNPVEIYAELSKKQLHKLTSGDYYMEFPYGTEVNYRQGSRVLNFKCENMKVAKELIDGLDSSYISWQIL